MWIHVRGFEVVDAEEAIVKLSNVFIDKITPRNVDTTAPIAIWVVIAIYIVADGGCWALARLLVDDQVPEL